MLASGRELGPYRIDHLLGVGGMGEVYRVTDTRLHRTVAVKVLPPAFAADPDFRARFDTLERKIILEGDVTQAMFASGFLLYVRDQVLLAQAFDPSRLALDGDAHVVANPIVTGSGIRSA